MSRVAFKQCDVQRALKAAKAVGYEHPSVEIDPDGTLRLLTAPQTDQPRSPLQKWRERQNAKRPHEGA